VCARVDRIEQFIASSGWRPDSGNAAPDQGVDKPETVETQDPASRAAAERQNGEDPTNSRDAEPSRWRRIATSENAGIASTLVGAADTVAQFGMHATPEGVVGLGATVLGLTALGLATVEKMRKEKK
jgi:hypothetical protein